MEVDDCDALAVVLPVPVCVAVLLTEPVAVRLPLGVRVADCDRERVLVAVAVLLCVLEPLCCMVLVLEALDVFVDVRDGVLLQEVELAVYVRLHVVPLSDQPPGQS